MASLEELYKKLEEYYKNFDDFDNRMNFVDTADEIISKNDTNSFPVLLKYFNDNDYTDYVWERLKKMLPRYGAENYTLGLLKHLHVMLPHAKDMTMWLICRILVDQSFLDILYKKIHLVGKNKEFLKILDVIYEDKELDDYKAVIDDIRKRLQEAK